MTDVQCACLRVEYKTTQNDNGTVTGRWLCAYGGDHEFVPIAQLRSALARAEGAEELVREAGEWLRRLEGEEEIGDRPPAYAALLARIAELEKP